VAVRRAPIIGENIMQHEYMLGRRIRGTGDEPRFILCVSPSGMLKTLRYSTNGMSSKLQCKEHIVNGRKEGVRLVTISEEARQNGWRTLEELYKLEDGEPRLQDCKSVYAWYGQVAARKSGRVKPLDPSYLPDALEVMKGSYVAIREIVIPPPQRGKRKRARRKSQDSEAPVVVELKEDAEA